MNNNKNTTKKQKKKTKKLKPGSCLKQCEYVYPRKRVECRQKCINKQEK